MFIFGHGVNFARGAFAATTQPRQNFTFSSIFCPYLTKKHSFLLKLSSSQYRSSSLYRDDRYGSLLIFFFNAPGIAVRQNFITYRKIFAPIICFLFSVIYILFLQTKITEQLKFFILTRSTCYADLKLLHV